MTKPIWANNFSKPEILKPIIAAGLIDKEFIEKKETCATSDVFSLNEKFLTSENVVIGTISKIKYLYKEGGGFRTAYKITIEETLKGSLKNNIKVYSFFGPNRKDHRRWKHNVHHVLFEEGDKGIFFINSMADNSTALKYMKKGLIFASDEIKSSYLISDTSLDHGYMKATQKHDEKNTQLNKIKKSFSEILRLTSN
ncbi:MAG: hypothetical protein OCD76_04380 [Reichenbachiella sp.]